MQLEDLYKLAGIQQSNTPAIEPKPVEFEQEVAEQPMDGRDNMKAMIALISPEQLNQLVGDAPVAEEMPGEATTEPNPEAYKGPLGSPADLSLRRYLGANGQPVHVDETKVYEDHKVEDISEAWQAYKIDEKKAKPDFADIDGDGDKEESMKKAAKDKKEKADESIDEARIEEEPNEGNEFSGALAQAKKDGKKEFEVDGKTYKVESDETNRLRHLAGMQVDEGMEKDEVMAIMMKYPEEVAKMKQMGDLDAGSDLYMALVDYYADEMPYGTMKARDGDPVEYIMMKLDDLGMMESTVAEEEAEVVEDENINMLKQLAGI